MANVTQATGNLRNANCETAKG